MGLNMLYIPWKVILGDHNIKKTSFRNFNFCEKKLQKMSFRILVGIYCHNIPTHSPQSGYHGVTEVAETTNPGGGGATPRFWTPTTPPTNCWPEAPCGGGGGGLREGRLGGGGLGGAIWGVGGGGAQAPLTSPCPPSNHSITINLTLTLAAS